MRGLAEMSAILMVGQAGWKASQMKGFSARATLTLKEPSLLD